MHGMQGSIQQLDDSEYECEPTPGELYTRMRHLQTG
jgi:hypothetical protein